MSWAPCGTNQAPRTYPYIESTPPLKAKKTVARDEFSRRRRHLMRLMGRDSIAILPAAPVRHRNNDVEYPYRQDSDFYYITGFGEPEAVAVLIPGREQGEYILFVRDRDPTRESWDGRRAGPEGATRDYGADDAFPIGDIDEILPGLLENRAKVFYTMGVYADFDQRVVGWVNGLRTQARNGRHPPQEFVVLDHVLHDMRLFKSRTELELMRESARIASNAHVRAMRYCRPGRQEYEVMAELLHEFRRYNADTSYHPIVGSGPNSCVLHYRDNDQTLQDGDLLLLDAGCEYECYASDITRTFPVNGRFSPEQRAVYEVVLEANEAAIAKVKPGNHWDDPHMAAVQAITQGLVKLGLLKGRVSKLVREGAYRRYFMHRTGHWLGMDVHDVGDYKIGDEWRVLEPGMAMTIEPGIYIPGNTRGVPKGMRNIGIRIEDDVVVTRTGAEVLTSNAPKTVDAIEAVMSGEGTSHARPS
jgi:Xaa-Pro aminopeptidase